MKKAWRILLCTVALLLVTGCTSQDNEKKQAVLYFALDKGVQPDRLTLYAVVEDMENSENNENNENKKETDGRDKTPQIRAYDGKNVSQAFERFFEDCKGIYTGTVKEYAVGESLGEEGVWDMKVYITNSPKLPAKRKTVRVDDVDLYLNEKALAKNNTLQ